MWLLLIKAWSMFLYNQWYDALRWVQHTHTIKLTWWKLAILCAKYDNCCLLVKGSHTMNENSLGRAFYRLTSNISTWLILNLTGPMGLFRINCCHNEHYNVVSDFHAYKIFVDWNKIKTPITSRLVLTSSRAFTYYLLMKCLLSPVKMCFVLIRLRHFVTIILAPLFSLNRRLWGRVTAN